MNEFQWKKYLKDLTGDFGREFNCKVKGFNHIHLAVDFFKELNIDAENKKFLDVGCGSNSVEEHIKAKWTGVDLFDYKDSTIYSDYVISDIHVLPFGNSKFDIVFCSHTLEHVLSPIIVMSEMKRVMKNGGDMIISVPLYPAFQGKDHNYIMGADSWKHMCTKRLGLKIMKAIEVKSCLCLHVKKDKVIK